MPTYQYACADTECGHRFELVQSFTDPTASECPRCGAAVRKVYGSVGVVFKGSGFYRTDSRSEAKKSASADTKDSAAGKEPSAPSSGAAGSAGGSGSSSGSRNGSGSGSAPGSRNGSGSGSGSGAAKAAAGT